MSDPTAELIDALIPAIKAGAATIAAFGAEKVRVFDLAQTNQGMPFVECGDVQATSAGAQGFDGADAVANLKVLDRDDPIGVRRAAGIAAGLVKDLDGQTLTLDSFRVVQLRWMDSRPAAPQPDGETVQVVVRFEISADPE